MRPPPPEAEPLASAVVVAAGQGDRFGAADKILLPLGGRPLVARVLDTIQAIATVQEVVVVVGRHTRDAVELLVADESWSKVRAIVDGGPRRQDSVANGIATTSDHVPLVVVHDAARPLATADLFDRCLRAALGRGAAIAAIPVSDTLKRVSDGVVRATVPRHDLWAAQTPQAFRRDLLLAALAHEIATTSTFTDEAGLVEALGLPVAVVLGESSNLKITVAADLALAEAFLHTHVPTGMPTLQSR